MSDTAQRLEESTHLIALMPSLPCGLSRGDKTCGNPASVAQVAAMNDVHWLMRPICDDCIAKSSFLLVRLNLSEEQRASLGRAYARLLQRAKEAKANHEKVQREAAERQAQVEESRRGKQRSGR